MARQDEKWGYNLLFLEFANSEEDILLEDDPVWQRTAVAKRPVAVMAINIKFGAIFATIVLFANSQHVKKSAFFSILLLQSTLRLYSYIIFLIKSWRWPEVEMSGCLGKTFALPYLFWIPRQIWKKKKVSGRSRTKCSFLPILYEIG